MCNIFYGQPIPTRVIFDLSATEKKNWSQYFGLVGEISQYFVLVGDIWNILWLRYYQFNTKCNLTLTWAHLPFLRAIPFEKLVGEGGVWRAKYFLRYELLSSNFQMSKNFCLITDRQTESDAYEPPVQWHRWAQKIIVSSFEVGGENKKNATLRWREPTCQYHNL